MEMKRSCCFTIPAQTTTKMLFPGSYQVRAPLCIYMIACLALRSMCRAISLLCIRWLSCYTPRPRGLTEVVTMTTIIALILCQGRYGLCILCCHSLNLCGLSNLVLISSIVISTGGWT